MEGDAMRRFEQYGYIGHAGGLTRVREVLPVDQRTKVDRFRDVAECETHEDAKTIVESLNSAFADKPTPPRNVEAVTFESDDGEWSPTVCYIDGTSEPVSLEVAAMIVGIKTADEVTRLRCVAEAAGGLDAGSMSTLKILHPDYVVVRKAVVDSIQEAWLEWKGVPAHGYIAGGNKIEPDANTAENQIDNLVLLVRRLAYQLRGGSDNVARLALNYLDRIGKPAGVLREVEMRTVGEILSTMPNEMREGE
jgi:hypothetical protein